MPLLPLASLFRLLIQINALIAAASGPNHHNYSYDLRGHLVYSNCTHQSHSYIVMLNPCAFTTATASYALHILLSTTLIQSFVFPFFPCEPSFAIRYGASRIFLLFSSGGAHDMSRYFGCGILAPSRKRGKRDRQRQRDEVHLSSSSSSFSYCSRATTPTIFLSNLHHAAVKLRLSVPFPAAESLGLCYMQAWSSSEISGSFDITTLVRPFRAIVIHLS